MQGSKKRFLSDRIGALVNGEEITIWNRLTVAMDHEVTVGSVERHHIVLAGDGSTGEKPDYITPAMDEKLQQLDVYPDAEVVDPTDDEVTIL